MALGDIKDNNEGRATQRNRSQASGEAARGVKARGTVLLMSRTRTAAQWDYGEGITSHLTRSSGAHLALPSLLTSTSKFVTPSTAILYNHHHRTPSSPCSWRLIPGFKTPPNASHSDATQSPTLPLMTACSAHHPQPPHATLHLAPTAPSEGYTNFPTCHLSHHHPSPHLAPDVAYEVHDL